MDYRPLSADLMDYAHRVFRAAISRREIIPVYLCEWCGCRTRQINGHHEDYVKPYNVIWLCLSCHGYRHSKDFNPEKLPQGEPVEIVITPLKEIVGQLVRRVETDEITKVLRITNWNRRQAAKRLKVSYRSLLYKIKEYGLIG